MSLGITAAGWGMAAAIGGTAVGIYGANKAANTQADAAEAAGQRGDAQYNQTRQDQLTQYNQQRADQAPYREAALPSIANLSRGLQPGGDYAKSFTLADYQADPGYEFRRQQGEQGIQRAAAAKGGAYSGATLKALANFNSGLASQEYGAAYSRFNTDKTTQFNRNATVAGIGQTANTAVGNAGTSAYGTIAQAANANTNQQSQALQNAGEARASGYVGTTNAIGSGIKQLYNGYQQNQALGSNTYVPYIGGASNQTANFDTYGPGYSP